MEELTKILTCADDVAILIKRQISVNYHRRSYGRGTDEIELVVSIRKYKKEIFKGPILDSIELRLFLKCKVSRSHSESERS